MMAGVYEVPDILTENSWPVKIDFQKGYLWDTVKMTCQL